ncbi:MarC family protein [Thermosulfurimonas dismutans]|uniref:UPF0056 membrane protein n=1 Tax=Thermosulfurimonas dismutans TaxID=999894 RepID=A0A179D5Y6_9BACT|nr:NAAT family transporter [Thermosulfurimonas dismutans]OAQ21456.1 Multiple antibiotic resistance protein marC [Thermosulfurimonas dismutans]
MDHALIGFILQVFLSFMAIMNPVGNTPIFLSLVNHLPEAERLRVARIAVLSAFVIVVAFTLGGNLLFRMFGITLPAFRIAGGILLFMIAYHLVRAKRSHQHHPTEEEHPRFSNTYEEEELEDVAITPLGTPILAGPGTITTALSLVGRKSDIFTIFIVLAVFGLVCLLTYLCFVYGEALVKRLRPSLIGVMTRLMGLILSVVAVQMVIEGLTEVISQLAAR